MWNKIEDENELVQIHIDFFLATRFLQTKQYFLFAISVSSHLKLFARKTDKHKEVQCKVLIMVNNSFSKYCKISQFQYHFSQTKWVQVTEWKYIEHSIHMISSLRIVEQNRYKAKYWLNSCVCRFIFFKFIYRLWSDIAYRIYIQNWFIIRNLIS